MKTLTALIFALLLTASPALAKDWTSTTKILVQPGKAVGAIVLGQPLPANAASLYGAPTSRNEPSPGADGKDTGSVVFGSTTGFEIKKGMLVKLNDGIGDDNVYAVYAKGVRAYTSEGLTMGMSLAKAKAIYPHGVEGADEMSGQPTLRIPGLVMLFTKNRLVEMVVRGR